MSVGLGQIVLIIFLLVLLFGNLPNLMKDIAKGIKYLKRTFQEDIQQMGDSKKETSSKGKDL
jgi:Sec-independent protein translocase protein TatA